jgi:hypothetical protein
VELVDPTAHAEVMALRAASTALGRHLIPDGIMYCSSDPCPMCLVACYWAQISRVVYAATSHDVATYGFEVYKPHTVLGAFWGFNTVQTSADPTTSQDAWAAGYAGVRPEDVMVRTLPYAWITAIGILYLAGRRDLQPARCCRGGGPRLWRRPR